MVRSHEGGFLKRISILYRIAGIVLAFVAIFSLALPDLQFNMASDKPIEMTLDELFKTPTADLPRYLRIKDAVVPSGSYIEQRKVKTNILQDIYYPVYPSSVKAKLNLTNLDSIQQALKKDSLAFSVTNDMSIIQNTNKIEARLVIHDTHVTDKDLDSAYFSSSDFTIEGQYDGTTLPNNIKRLLTDENIKISDNALMLKRGEKGMSTSTAIAVIIGAFLMGVLCILTLIPSNTLARFAGFNGTWEEYSQATTVITTLPTNTTVAPFAKRIMAYIIDYAIILVITYSLPIEKEDMYLAGTLLVFLYFTATDIALKGSSIGKMVLKQKVSALDGDFSSKDIIIRNVVKTLSNMFPLIFLYALSNDAKQTIHDLAAKTIVAEKESNRI
ncbi:MAG: RDD family protein [Flavobacterium sp.]|nr:MAG: RDD family protein [Flavobacterium sp.]